MSAILARVARLLDLDRARPGERTQWTVRLSHGVYLVELEQFVSGTRVRVDGETVGRSPAWSFPAVPFRFAVGQAVATLALHPDTTAGTVRATLIVDGARITADPAAAGRPPRPFRWGRVLARMGYALGALFVSAAVIGDPYQSWIVDALRTAVAVVWLAVVRGIDPLALIPGWLAAATSSRAALMAVGIELIALVTLSRSARLRSLVPVLRDGGRIARTLGWAALIALALVLPTLLAG